MTMFRENISRYIKQLISIDIFYGYFLSFMKKENTTRVPLMGVSYSNKEFKLLVNYDAWNNLEEKYKLSVLIHEIKHIAYFHLFLGKNYSNKKRLNIAADLVVNQNISPLPDWCYKIEDYPNLTVFDSLDYYYNNLPDDIEDIESFNLHYWEIAEEDQIAVKLHIQDFLLTLEREIKNPGSIPKDMQKIINGFKKPKPVFDYKKFLQKYVSNHSRPIFKNSRSKENIYYEDEACKIRVYLPKILVFQDQSGSVSERELKEFNNELYHLTKKYDVKAYSFDTEVGKEIVISKDGESATRNKCGGTDIQCCIDKYKKQKDVNTCIVFTDGHFYPVPTCYKNILFVVCSRGTVSNLTNQKHVIQIQ